VDAGIAAELDRIEAAVRAGDTDLAGLGFWRLVGRVKRDPALVEDFAEQVGRIDRAAFEARVRPRFPVWFGNGVLLGVVFAGAAAIGLAIGWAPRGLAGLALVAGALAWSVGVHSPTHWLVGRLVGMRFVCYFLGGPPPPRPGLKVDYATYLRTPPAARAGMHASGAIATKLAPFAALVFYPVTNAQAWAAWIVLGIGVLQIATDVLFSRKTSDWKRVRRELAVARDLSVGEEPQDR